MIIGMKYIKQWGLKRSGTNAARFMVEANFREVRVLADVLGWKHGPPSLEPEWDWRKWYPERGSGTHHPLNEDEMAGVRAASRQGAIMHMLLVKDPYAWLVSSLRWRGTPLKSAGRELIKKRIGRWLSWSREALRFKALCAEHRIPCEIWHCETLARELPKLRHAYDLDWKTMNTVLPSRPLRPTGDLRQGAGMMHERGRFDQSYYDEARYFDDYRPEQLRTVAETLDPEVVERMGYNASVEARLEV
jgi:hypothetical protein